MSFTESWLEMRMFWIYFVMRKLCKCMTRHDAKEVKVYDNKIYLGSYKTRLDLSVKSWIKSAHVKKTEEVSVWHWCSSTPQSTSTRLLWLLLKCPLSLSRWYFQVEKLCGATVGCLRALRSHWGYWCPRTLCGSGEQTKRAWRTTSGSWSSTHRTSRDSEDRSELGEEETHRLEFISLQTRVVNVSRSSIFLQHYRLQVICETGKHDIYHF